jgi:hypothetical protein
MLHSPPFQKDLFGEIRKRGDGEDDEEEKEREVLQCAACIS